VVFSAVERKKSEDRPARFASGLEIQQPASRRRLFFLVFRRRLLSVLVLPAASLP